MFEKKLRAKVGRLENPRLVNSIYFNLRLGENGLEYPRFAFIVSKKIDKRATVRNSIKRKLRSCMEELKDEILPGKDFLFYPKKSILESSREEIFEDTKKILLKNSLIK